MNPTQQQERTTPIRKTTKTPANNQPSLQARRIAALILEVMAGARTPSQAAETMKVSISRYYNLELRAMKGLVQACEPRPRGPGQSPQKQVEQLRRQVQRLEMELHRYQALARTAQRVVGVSAPKATGSSKTNQAKGSKRRRRKPTARALRIAERMKPVEAEPVTVPMNKTDAD